LNKILKIISYSPVNSFDSSHGQLSEECSALNAEESLFLLKPKKEYLVLAVEYPSDASHAQFWIIGEHSSQLRSNNIFFPDIINANACEIADPRIPADWLIGIFHYKSGTRTIIGPPKIISANFLERLSNSEPEAIDIFKQLLVGLI